MPTINLPARCRQHMGTPDDCKIASTQPMKSAGELRYLDWKANGSDGHTPPPPVSMIIGEQELDWSSEGVIITSFSKLLNIING